MKVVAQAYADMFRTAEISRIVGFDGRYVPAHP